MMSLPGSASIKMAATMTFAAGGKAAPSLSVQRSRHLAIAVTPRLLLPTPCRPKGLQATARNEESPSFGVTGLVVNALFSFPPFFSFAAKQARKTIKDRAKAIGVDWDEELRKYTGIDWEAERECVKQTGHPEYYCRPFHAYPDGNLGWQPAHEVEVAAQSVHAAVFSPDPELDEDGDGRLRRSYSACMKSLMDKYDARAVANVVDIGCATGLSSLELARAFPGARVAGVDLSEYFLSVAEWNRRQAGENSHEHSRIQYHHAMGEATGLPSCSADLVSTCLVFHELPQDAAVGILKEAYRLLRPGGALAIMEMNPKSPAFQRIANNVMAFTAFKSTEPYLDQYTSLDLHGQIAAQGFALSDEVECSPRHRTVVAIKR